MRAAEFEKLRAFEESYWWYEAQRRNLIDAVGLLPLPRNARVLDAGCGSGRNLSELARIFSIEAFGVDCSPHAAALWNGERDVHRCRASANALPFAEEDFDVVVSVDVFQCRELAPEAAMGEMARVLRSGGFVVLLAPAYDWMRSRHDAAVESVRRFSRRRLRILAESAGLAVQRLTHRFPLFFPIIAAKRLLEKPADASDSTRFDSDLTPIPRWLNGCLSAVARVERAVVRGWTVPFGSTILMVARKAGA